jgi:hypothetical protein
MSLQSWDRRIGSGRSAVGRLARLAVRQRVDDAVVILQNIHCHLEDGSSLIEAALTTQQESADDHWCAWTTRLIPAFRGDVS